jgi:hypothetical protein
MAALDKRTVDTAWPREPLPNKNSERRRADRIEGPAYGRHPTEVNGRQQLGVTASHFFGVNAETGEREWQFEMPTRYESFPARLLCERRNRHRPRWRAAGGWNGFRGRASGGETRWTTTLDTCHGGVLEVTISYGSGIGHQRLGAVDLRDGSVRIATRNW